MWRMVEAVKQANTELITVVQQGRCKITADRTAVLVEAARGLLWQVICILVGGFSTLYRQYNLLEAVHVPHPCCTAGTWTGQWTGTQSGG
jgi:hypothetical protein